MIDTSIFIVNDTSLTGHPGCVRVTSEIRRNLRQRGIRLAGSWPVGIDLWVARRLHPRIDSASAFVVNGEGTIHHTANRRRARQLASFARKCKASSDKPVFLVNASIQDIEDRDFDDLCHYDRIYVRDRQSRSYLASHGVASEFVPDLTLLTDEIEVERGEKLLVTDSVLTDVTQDLKDCSRRLGADYLPMRARKARGYWRYVSQKRSVLHARSSRYVEKIARANAVLTGRFHAMLFCIVAGTPFLAVPSNTGKIEAALADIFTASGRLLVPEALSATPGLYIPPFTAEEEACRQAYLALARQRASTMFDQITADVCAAQARI